MGREMTCALKGVERDLGTKLGLGRSLQISNALSRSKGKMQSSFESSLRAIESKGSNVVEREPS